MSSLRRFADGRPRAPSWAERDWLSRLRESGAEDVYVEPGSAPRGFWNAIMGGTTKFLPVFEAAEAWSEWVGEMITALGLAPPSSPGHAYDSVLELGHWTDGSPVDAGVRLTAVEFLLDAFDDPTVEPEGVHNFTEFVNERARWFHVGVRLEGNRFVPTTSEILHVEIVQPTLGLLSDPRFADVDILYRKGFDRALAGDASGAVTAAISAVEETLRVLLPGMTGQTLGPLAEKARKEGVISKPIEEFAKKLYGLRPESDAHAAGTTDFDVAMLALHLAGSLLLYLGRAAEGKIN